MIPEHIVPLVHAVFTIEHSLISISAKSQLVVPIPLGMVLSKVYLTLFYKYIKLSLTKLIILPTRTKAVEHTELRLKKIRQCNVW